RPPSERSANHLPARRDPSQRLTTRGSSSTCASQAARESPASIGSQIAYTVSLAFGWALRMCCRTQLVPIAQTLQVGEASRISRGSPERVLNNDRSCPMSRRSLSVRVLLDVPFGGGFAELDRLVFCASICG